MIVQELIFYAFSLVMIFAAVAVITVRNPVYAVLFLVLAFFSAAGIWMLLEAEFLAIILVVVYVGAVMVLFLFVVMMLDIDTATLKQGFTRYLPLGVVVVGLIIAELVLVLGTGRFGLSHYANPVMHSASFSNTRELGSVLYTQYVYPFEIAAVILLLAIVAAITLTLRRREGTRHQDPSWQVRVRPRDRVRLVKMRSEKRG